MKHYQKSLAIVCPVANEEATIEKFIHEVIKEASVFEKFKMFVIMDNSSTDNTLKIVKNLLDTYTQLKLIFDPTINSVAGAYISGYRKALQYDWVLTIDSGFSHKPNQMHRFFNMMDKNKDCVFGTRFAKGGSYQKPYSFSRKFISKYGTFLTNKLLRTHLSDMTSGFECFKGTVLDWILRKGIRSRGPFFQTEIKYYAHEFDIDEVPITYSNPSHKVRVTSIFEAFRILFWLVCNRLNFC